MRPISWTGHVLLNPLLARRTAINIDMLTLQSVQRSTPAPSRWTKDPTSGRSAAALDERSPTETRHIPTSRGKEADDVKKTRKANFPSFFSSALTCLSTIRDADGRQRFVWGMPRVPRRDDLCSARQIRLSLYERRGKWSSFNSLAEQTPAEVNCCVGKTFDGCASRPSGQSATW